MPQPTSARASLALLASATCVLAAVTYEPKNDPLPVQADWHARAEAWFEATDAEARKKEMRAATSALRQPCKYCHTEDFTDYTERKLIGQQMMALSAEHGVPCGDCHAGKNTLTPLGVDAQAMWVVSRERKVFCDACHVKGTRFEKLTRKGRRFKPEWKKHRAVIRAAPAGAPAPAPAPLP